MSLRDTLMDTLTTIDVKAADAKARKSHLESKTWVAAGNEVRSALGLPTVDADAKGDPEPVTAPDGSTSLPADDAA